MVGAAGSLLLLASLAFSGASLSPEQQRRFDASAQAALSRAAHLGNSSVVERIAAARPFSSSLLNGVQEDYLLTSLAAAHHAMEGLTSPTAARDREALSSHMRTLKALLAAGADASRSCAVLDAAIFRNGVAMDLLLRALNETGLGSCLESQFSTGESLLHILASSKASGFARILFRATLPEERSRAAWAVVKEHARLSRPPAWEADARTLTKAAIDASVGHADLRALLRVVRERGSPVTRSALRTALRLADEKGLTPIVKACSHGLHSVVRELWALAKEVGAFEEGEGPLSERSTDEALAPKDARWKPAESEASVAHKCLLQAEYRGYDEVVAAIRVLVASAAAPHLPPEGADDGETADGTLSTCDSAGRECLEVEPGGETKDQGFACSLHEHQREGWGVLTAPRLAAIGLSPSVFLDGLCASRVASDHSAAPSSSSSASNDMRASRMDSAASDGPWGNARLLPLLRVPNEVDSIRAAVDAGSLKDRPFVFRATGGRRLYGKGRVNGTGAAETNGRYLSSARALLAEFAHLNVSMGSLPYASLYGKVGKRIQIGEFVRGFMGSNASCDENSGGTNRMQAHAAPDGAATPPQTPLFLCDEPSYVFDSSVIREHRHLFATLLDEIPTPLRATEHGLEQFILGPAGSGSMPHFHGKAANLLLFGLKIWVIVPPGGAAFYDGTALSWFRESFGRNGGFSAGSNRRFYAALQQPGDVLVVPEHWGHAVLNLADSFAIAIE